jgi:hypothetical protein
MDINIGTLAYVSEEMAKKRRHEREDMVSREVDFNKIELGTEYIAKDQFGFRISYSQPFIIVHLEIYDENKKCEIIDIFRIFVNYMFEDNKEKGIKKVFLVDAQDVKKQLAKRKDNIDNRKEFIIETPDLLTGEFVPLLSKIKEIK